MTDDESRAALKSPRDMDEAHEEYGAACGHGSFAAACEMSVKGALNFFTRYPMDGNRVQSWVNIPQMAAALQCARVPFTRSPKGQWPVNGIAGIQFLGPWMNFARAACTKRHFVAVREIEGRRVWDCNLQGWVSFAGWHTWAIARLLPARATGYSIISGFEIRTPAGQIGNPDDGESQTQARETVAKIEKTQ